MLLPKVSHGNLIAYILFMVNNQGLNLTLHRVYDLFFKILTLQGHTYPEWDRS